MACLIKSKNKPLLDSYTDILGSEDAAYYVLCKNNGYTLEFTPSGEKSDLFQQLLVKNNYDYEDAIREKAEMYYSSYYDTIGGDWTMSALDGKVVDEKGEPLIQYKPQSIDFSDVVSQPIKLDERDVLALPEIQRNLIENDLDAYLRESEYNDAYEKHSKKVEWLAEKQKKLVGSINKDLIEAFNLEKHIDKDGNVTFTSKDKDDKGRYLVVIQFCEYLENGKLGVYDQTERLEAAANLIQISLTDANPATINHELAHHYIRMFWNSEVIQAAAQKLDTGDRSEGWQVRLEEKLVNELVKRTVEADTIWGKIGDMIKTTFLWIVSPIKQRILQKASLAFRLNDQSQQIQQEQYLLSFIDPTAKRVFSSSPNAYIQIFKVNLSFADEVIKDYMIHNFINEYNVFCKQEQLNHDNNRKRKFEEYIQYIKNLLCDTQISDQEFSNFYTIIENNNTNVKSIKSNINDPEYIAAENLLDIFKEIRVIRDDLKKKEQEAAAEEERKTNSPIDIKELMSNIMRGLSTRVYEYLRTVPKAAGSANDIQELIQKLQALQADVDKLGLFVAEGWGELSILYKKLSNLERNNWENLTAQQLQSMWNTIEGFYIPVIDLILGHNDYVLLTQDQIGLLNEFGTKFNNLQIICSNVKSLLIKANKEISRRDTHSFLVGEDGDNGAISDLLTDEQKNRFLENFDDQLIFGKLFEDINSLQPYIGLASRSKSLVVRVARNMILSATAEVRKATLKDAARIIKIYFDALPELRKLNNKEIQSIFQEMDEKGLPTGYFVRRLNYGKFYRNLNETRDNLVNIANDKLKAALGDDAPQITYDAYNNPVLPPDDDPVIKSILYEYADELDEWLCKNAERMFTSEYYRMRRRKLSPNTRKVMQDIQNRIDAIMSKAPILKITSSNGTESDIQATWELSPEDQYNLVRLRMEYQQLGNHYYSDGTKKDGEDFKIANEISEFNEWKNGFVEYKQNEERFNAAIDKIRETHGRNSLEEARFRKLNTTIVVNPAYYDFVMSKVRLVESARLDELRKRRNDLKKLIQDFDKKGIDVEQKRRQTEYWNSLKEVDSAIQEILSGLNSGPVTEEEKWSTYFETEMVMYDETETLLDHMLKQDMLEFRRMNPDDSISDDDLRANLITKYQYEYTYYDDEGVAHQGVSLCSVFTRHVPRGTSINEAYNDESRMEGVFSKDALIVRYSQQFSDIDTNSQFYNKNFDRNDSNLVQPRADLYDNSKQFDIINNNEKIKKLYDALIELMNRNNAKLPTNSGFNYKLPQITARRLIMLRRSGSLKEMCDTLKYTWDMEFKLNERDDNDTNYEDNDLKTRANGTRINTVPVRYTRSLEHPEFITSDVIGSVIAFTEMANNFVVKTQLSSELEIIKQQLQQDGRSDPDLAKIHNKQSTKNIIKQLSNMMDDQIYENRTKYWDKSTDFTKKEQRMIKFMTHFQRLGRILMLGWNFASMSLGFFESFTRGHIEAFLGKDYTLRDLMHGHRHMLKYGLYTFGYVGSVQAKTKQVALMQRFGLSKRLTESYRGTERRRLLKVLNENLDGMFGFTLGDYANSSFQLAMALSNVRFIENIEGIPNGFYTKLSLIRAIQKSNPNLSYREAKNQATRLYKESDICLEDAYDFNDGIITVKEEYQQYVTDTLENRITGKCYQRLAESLGVVPNGDSPGYSLYILLRPFGVLRSYLFTTIARNWNWAHDFQHRYLDKNGNIVKEDDMLDGYLDIDAGNMNIGIHQGIIGWMKMMMQKLPIIKKKADSFSSSDEMKEVYNYAAGKVGLELLAIAVFVGISTLFKAMAKGADDDDWWYRFGYLTSVRLVNSFISILDPTSLLEVIKNISTLISPLNDLMRCITVLSDTIGLSGHSPFDEIQTGSYKGRSRLFRNLIRITPFGNAYEDLASPALKARANWYLQQDPITWGTLGGAYDQLWGTGN